jgi:prolyl oligopeptidase
MALVLTGVVGASCAHSSWTYPPTEAVEQVDDYHGTLVSDPYRWLEDDLSPETRRWTEAQNRLTSSFVEETGFRGPLVQRLTELWNFPRFSAPSRRGPYVFFSKNDGLQNQDVLFVAEGLDGPPTVLLDPNTLSDDGTVALSGGAVSKSGRMLAYGLSRHGSDSQEFRIRDVITGKDLPETIRFCKFSTIAWVPSSDGDPTFYYNRFPDPTTVPEEDRNNHSSVYLHALRTPQSDDTLVFHRPDAKELGFYPFVTEDGRFLVLSVHHGTDPRNGLYYARLDGPTPPGPDDFTRLLEPGRAMFSFIEHHDGRFLIHTDLDAPRGRVIAIDPDRPDPEFWQDRIAQHEIRVLDWVLLAGGQLVVASMEHAHHELLLYRLDGSAPRQVPLGDLGSIAGLSGRPDQDDLFVTFMSFLTPPMIFRVDLTTHEVSVFRKPEIPFDSSAYETRQVFYSSKDGTQVPMFLTMRKGIPLDGSNPVLLYGYGGFNINLTPRFSTSWLVFLEQGGIYAVANLRGGAEYGEEWHKAGMLENKQNVFDDFIAAAEFLVNEGYSRPDRIGILGGSNGGLLVTAVEQQRPDLFGAVVAAVPVTDMLRYHRFTVGRYWVPEYGNAETDPEHFRFLHKYSPLHNVQSGVDYPPTLVTTADTDDRVVPGHARKFVAAMQAKAGRRNPTFIRIETRAGHGAGKPTAKRIEEAADILAFLFHFLKMNPAVR